MGFGPQPFWQEGEKGWNKSNGDAKCAVICGVMLALIFSGFLYALYVMHEESEAVRHKPATDHCQTRQEIKAKRRCPHYGNILSGDCNVPPPAPPFLLPGLRPRVF